MLSRSPEARAQLLRVPFLVLVWHATDRQCSLGHVARHGRSGCDVCAGSDRHGRDELGVAPDEHVRSDRCRVFANAIVVAEYRSSADVRLLADDTVAEVREVVRLRSTSETRLLRFDEVADVGVFADFAVLAEVRKRPNLGPRPDCRIGGDAVGLDDGSFADVDVREHTPHVHRRPTTDPCPTSQHDTSLERDIRLQRHLRVDADARAHRSAREAPSPGDPCIHQLFDPVELLAIVDARERVGAQDDGFHGNASEGRVSHSIGQVELPLGIVGCEGGQRLSQEGNLPGIDARIDLPHGPLVVASKVAMFPYLQHSAHPPDDSPISGWVLDDARGKRQLRMGKRAHDRLKLDRRDQRDVPIQNQDRAE